MSGSAGNRVDGNAISNSTFAGIETDSIERTTISGNRVVHDQTGIILVGDANTVVRNRIDDAFACDGCGYGISMEGGSHNVVARNVVTRSSHIGIRLDAFAPPATANVIRDNLVLATGDDGIAINPEDVGAVTETVLDAQHCDRLRRRRHRRRHPRRDADLQPRAAQRRPRNRGSARRDRRRRQRRGRECQPPAMHQRALQVGPTITSEGKNMCWYLTVGGPP